MKRSYPHVLAAFYGSPWAILPTKLQEIEAVLWRRITGDEPAPAPAAFDDSDYFEPRPQQEKKPYKMQGAAAVIPIHGTITPRPSVFSSYSGGTSAEGIGRAVEQAAADPQAEAIVLDIDSPGGSVFGLPEAAAKIFAARKSKPIYAVANHVAASAAYWIASQAHTIAVTPAGQVGSIGVIWAHTDHSKFDEKLGRKTTYVAAGQFKAEGAPDFPLSTEARDEMQRTVNEYYAMFLAGVSRGRGTGTAAIERDFGQGRMRLAQESVTLKMADRVATLETIVNEINASRAAKSKRKAGTSASAGRELPDERTARVLRMVAADLVANGLRTDVGARSTKLTAPTGPAALRWSNAVHEAGHVVTALALGGRAFSAHCNAESGSADCSSPGDTLTVATVYFAGGLAENAFVAGTPDRVKLPDSAAGDWQKLEALTRDTSTLEHAHGNAKRILAENAGSVERLARRLAERGYLTGAEIEAVVGNVVPLAAV